MKTTECPACHQQKSIIIDSRLTSDKDRGCVQRRRECQACGQRWHTWEFDREMVEKVRKAVELMREVEL